MPYCPNPFCEHRKRLGEPAEFKPGVTTCSDCGSKLTENIPVFPSQATTPTLQYADFKSVFIAENISQVSIFKALLEQRGIKCWIISDALSAGIGGLPPVETWPQLCVENDDYAEAKHILEEAITAKDSTITWKCDSCGEVIEEQFTECWNCGKSRLGTNQDAAINNQEEDINNSNNYSDPVDDEERKQTLRGFRIILLILSGYSFLVSKCSLQPGQDPKKGLIGLAILLLLVFSFTYLPKGSK